MVAGSLALDSGVKAFFDQADARLLIVFLFVHELAKREERHHDLLRKRQPSRVVERHITAVGDNAVDEAELSRCKRDRAVPLIELRKNWFSRRSANVIDTRTDFWGTSTTIELPALGERYSLDLGRHASGIHRGAMDSDSRLKGFGRIAERPRLQQITSRIACGRGTSNLFAPSSVRGRFFNCGRPGWRWFPSR